MGWNDHDPELCRMQDQGCSAEQYWQACQGLGSMKQDARDIKREQDRHDWLEEQEERLGKGNYHDA